MMPRFTRRQLQAAMCLLIATTANPVFASEVVTRGRYLVQIAGCNDCHTPGYFFGKADPARYLGGSDVGLQTPQGTFVGPNLTSDPDTGLGRWSDAQILRALRSGVRPDGRVLSPLMPWAAFANLSDEDAQAIVAYLRSLRPLRHAVPKPFGPNEAPTVSVLRLVPYTTPATTLPAHK